MIALIVAYDLNGTIGRNGALPWHLPDDLARFRELTLGHSVLMGRKTFESIGGRLSGRFNFVLSRDPAFRPADVRVESSLDVLADETWASPGRDLFVIGGAEVYAAALPHVERAYITGVYTRVAGDNLTRFPCDLSRWSVDVESIEHHDRDERHAHAFAMMTAVRP